MSDHRDDLPEEPQGKQPDGPVVPGGNDPDKNNTDAQDAPFGEETWISTDPFALPPPDPDPDPDPEPDSSAIAPSGVNAEPATAPDPEDSPFQDEFPGETLVRISENTPFHDDPDSSLQYPEAATQDEDPAPEELFHDADTDPDPDLSATTTSAAPQPSEDVAVDETVAAPAPPLPTPPASTPLNTDLADDEPANEDPADEDPTAWFRNDPARDLTATALDGELDGEELDGELDRALDGALDRALGSDETIELPIEMIRGGPEPAAAPPPHKDGFVLRYPEDTGWHDAVDQTLTDVLTPNALAGLPTSPEARDPDETDPAPADAALLIETATRPGHAPATPVASTHSGADATEPDTDLPHFDAPEPVSDELETLTGDTAAPVPQGRRRRTGPERSSWLSGLRARLPSFRLDFGAVKRAARGWFTDLKQRWRETAKARRAELKLDRDKNWWRKTLLEIAILYSIIIPIEFAVSGGKIGSFGTHPHPYWLIILPMAGARGVVAGLLAAVLGAVLFFLGALQARGGGDIDGLLTYALMREPILFFAVGFFLGELRDELALRYGKLEQLVKDLKERGTRLRQERDVLAEANRLLETRIVDDSVQFGNMIVAATRIERSGRAEVFEVALDMVEEHCGAGASVLMLLEGGSLDYLCHRGWPDDEVGERLAAARASEFVARAIADGTSVNGFEGEESPPEEGPLVVAPLIYSGGVVKALLCLDDVPPERLNESTVTVFFGIAEWVSAALARLARGAEMPAPPAAFGPLAQPGAWLGTHEDLGERLRLEVERCTRYGVPTSFLAIQAPEWKDVTFEGGETLDHFMTTHFTGGLRPSDELFRFGFAGCYFLVLAGTDVKGAEVVRQRLLRRVEYSPNREIGAIRIFATGPDAEAPDLASLVERVSAHFRDASPLPLDGQCPIDIPTEPAAGTIEDFVRRLRMESSLATRNSFDLHVLGIRADTPAEAEHDLLARHVRAAGVYTLRPTDGVYPLGAGQVAIICPCTNSEQAATVAHRLARAVRERDPDAPYGDLETQVLTLGSVHPDAGSFLAALAGGRSGSGEQS